MVSVTKKEEEEEEEETTNNKHSLKTLQFVVKDTGIGIPQVMLDKMFLPFSQADSSVSRRFGGTGLGLAICKQLVELLRGKIWLKSVENEGTEVYFTMSAPAAEQEEIEQMKRQAESTYDVTPRGIPNGQEGPQEKRLKLLMAEDNNINQKLMLRILEKVQYPNVKLVENGVEVLQELEKNHYDLVLLDIMMPLMDGYFILSLNCVKF